MKKCSENCKNINRLTSCKRGVKWQWQCLAQKNTPFVELGDECTAHDCDESGYDDCIYRNSATNECGVGKCYKCYRPSTSCNEFSGINYTTWKVILKDKKPYLTLGDTKDKVVYWTGTKSDCEKFIKEFWESITSITENDDPKTIEKAKQDIRAYLKMVQQIFGSECKVQKNDELRDEMKVDFDFKSTDAKDDFLSEIKCFEKTIECLTAIRIADRNERKVAFDFLLTKKMIIKRIIKEHHDIRYIKKTICEIFNNEYLYLYPNNNSIFRVISDKEFFDWCKENIEGFKGGKIEPTPQYWCGIKE